MIPEKINTIISKLEELETYKKNCNDELLEFCQNKSISLKERWDIWNKYVNKSYKEYIKRDWTSPFLKFINDKITNQDYVDRHDKVDYKYFLDIVDGLDENDHEDIQIFLREVTISSILEDKEFDFYAYAQEEILKENFGSYRFDW
jgi:hypothetical protein